ncbi:hypothetical protein QZH46_27745 [Pseudomonas corrugata]
MTNNINYLCIDDQADCTIDQLLSSIESGGGISLERWTPTALDSILPRIKAFIDANQSNGAGVLLDLRLDMDSDQAKERVNYRGPTLAQELRTRMAEGGIPPAPIVLWSVNSKFKSSYNNEDTSHDLFDDVYEKDREIVENPSVVASRLVSLAKGYKALHGASGASMALSLLALDSDIDSMLYAQFLDEYKELVDKRSVHDIARLLLNDLVRVQGLLVGEKLLAARLGVDIAQSGNSWAVIKSALQFSSYAGPFCEGWNRWWWYKVEGWWFELFGDKYDLRGVSSLERVGLLNDKLDVNLAPASPIAEGYSTKFFTLCAGTSRPLDPHDGLRVVCRGARDWHDPAYVSIYAALERIGRGVKWRLDPLERQRLDAIRKI